MDHSVSKIKILTFAALAFVAICAFIAPLFLSTGATEAAYAQTDYKTVGKAAYMIDQATGTVIYSRNEKARLPIASMVKIMTTLLTLEAVDRGEVTLDDMVTVSDEAAGMGGSQVFLDAGSQHKLSDLLKTVIVASANDSCVALAEKLEGSVSGFVSKMNARAQELGMQNTSFKNCTGLPAAESFSCAEDVAKMFCELIKHPVYFEYSKVWLEEYAHPSGRTTTISNTNKLVRFYKGCDGGKTGYTGEAKFCLAATAQRDGMRIIAVMIGAPSSKERNAAVSAMFDDAFANYSNQVMIKAGDPLDRTVPVRGGKRDRVEVTVESDVTRFTSRNDASDYQVKVELSSGVKAPVRQGDRLGVAYLVKDGEVISQTNVVALSSVGSMSLFDAIGEIGKHWATGMR